MKNTLFYYYQLAPEKIIKEKKYYYFISGEYIYYLYLVDKPVDYVNEILALNKYLINSSFMEIMLNINGNAISLINNHYYILLRNLKDKMFNIDILYHPFYCYGNMLNLKLLNHSNWGELWSKKIDYFEYQKNYIKIKYRILYKTIDYFIGLAENAISYFNAVNNYLNKENDDVLVVARRRIDLNDFSFYNPLNIVIDNKARDTALYLKHIFIEDNYTYDFIDEFLANLNYSTYQYGLLMARLLFPNYYFDFYEKIINDNAKEKEIISIIGRTNEYEVFLKYIYHFISKKKPILKIDWLDIN